MVNPPLLVATLPSRPLEQARRGPGRIADLPAKLGRLLRRSLLFLLAALVMTTAAAEARLPTELEDAAREFGAKVDKYLVEENIMVSMRDGVRLSTSVIRPRDRRSLATVLVRTPYDMPGELRKSIYRKFFANDYAVVMQNERGTHWSEGNFQFLAGARDDGYDTLTWIAGQSWSNGKVGTLGCSSAAENQLSLGTMQHPAHRAMIAQAASAGIGVIPGATSRGPFFRNGVPLLAPWVRWYAVYGHKHRPKLPADVGADERDRLASAYSPEASRLSGNAKFEEALTEALDTLPSKNVMRDLGMPETDFDTWITMSPTDPRWAGFDFINAHEKGAVPALNVNSWGDLGPYETSKLFEFQKHHPDQYMIIAPTAHCDMLKATEKTMVGERDVGDARLGFEDLYLRWFDQQLKGRKDAFKGVPKVQVYLMGANRWLSGDDWPLKGIRETRYFLESRGAANSLYGDGLLTLETPSGPPDRFVSDPANPVPSKGGGCCDRRAYRDQTDVETRHDVLVYSTPVLTEGLSAVGELKAVLYLSTSALDGDIAVKLVDVYPDGKAFNLQDTIVRLRYRDGYDNPTPTEPGRIYRVEVTGLVTGNHFGPGHRMRIEIAGSNFPNYERNLNTGGPNQDQSAGVVGKVSIYHDAERASYLSVPVLTSKSSSRR